MTLVLEANHGAEWIEIGRMEPGEPPGSVSNIADGNRQIIQFSTKPGCSLIEQSIGGADGEVGQLRIISSLGFKQLADIGDGEHFEIPIQTERMTQAATIRFRHIEASGPGTVEDQLREHRI